MKIFNVWLIGLALVGGGVAQAQLGGILDRNNDRDNRPGGEFIVIRTRGRVESISSPDRFVISSKGLRFRVDYRQTSGRSNLRVGDQVHVSGQLIEQDRITAEELEVTQRGRGDRSSTVLTGQIRSINRQTGRMSVETPRGPVAVGYNTDTEWVRNNSRSRLDDFKVGDRVRIVGFEGRENVWRARRVIQGGRAGYTTGGVGEIVGLDARNQEMEVDFEGEIWTVRLRGATLRRANRPVQLDDLRLGQDVRITGTARAGERRVEATSVDVLRDLPNRD